ncbi:MAG: DNA alkylation repair protein [Candidatus Pacebacteria bacterium]|nr:DNA alkylation repair protein [Candidatus Paceibacterota bacterium]
MKKHKNVSVAQLKKEMGELSDLKQAKILQGFFKTGKGDYGEGDIFLGIKVPVQRKIAQAFRDLSLNDIKGLLESKIHEHRFIALIILIDKYQESDFKNREVIFDFYLENSKNINNWDLVDVSAPKILGDYLLNKPRNILYELAKSQPKAGLPCAKKNLWQKRIAIVSTLAFIKDDDFKDTLKISKILLLDENDLIQKAIGWMLREVGKRNQEIEEGFLKKNYSRISRVTLKYAIEKFDTKTRNFYLKK